MTKKNADINSISKDLFPKTYNRTMIDDDYIKQLEQENKQLKEVIDKAVLELVNIDGNLSNSQLSDRICNLIDVLKEVSK